LDKTHEYCAPATVVGMHMLFTVPPVQRWYKKLKKELNWKGSVIISHVLSMRS